MQSKNKKFSKLPNPHYNNNHS